jgi:hypothetical protein
MRALGNKAPKPMKIPKKWIKRFNAAALSVKDGDLYTALHYVGDDMVKDDIEIALKELLPAATFKKVAAVFHVCTTEYL